VDQLIAHYPELAQSLGLGTAPASESPSTPRPDYPFPLALNTMHQDCHKAADAFWKHWNKYGETHRRGYYESTWGAINCALRMIGVREHHYGQMYGGEPTAALPAALATPTEAPADVQGASPSATALSAPALRASAPIAGAWVDVQPHQVYEAFAAEFIDDDRPWSRVKGDLRRAYRDYAKFINLWGQRCARDQARSATTEGRGPKDAEPGGEATRPEATSPQPVAPEGEALRLADAIDPLTRQRPGDNLTLACAAKLLRATPPSPQAAVATLTDETVARVVHAFCASREWMEPTDDGTMYAIHEESLPEFAAKLRAALRGEAGR
jgi:hypothetical protein